MYCTESRMLENNSQESEGKQLYCGSAMTQIKEETEYVKKMRITLQNMRQQLFGNEGEVADNRQAQELKLEASQEAGAAALRKASQKLFENYQKQMDELRQRHDEEKHKLQTFAEEQEQSLKRNVENYNNLILQLQQKQNRATELEKLIERMEKEKKELIERKQSMENNMEWKSSTSMDVPDGSSRFQDFQLEVSTLQEKIFHLDSVVTQQHRNLYSVINTIENLKMKLSKQDQIILSLREQVGILEAENKELKYKTEVYSEKQNKNASPVSSVSYESARNKTPYQMLMKWKKNSA
ncbi:hypothetical protein chiPu_0012641 [Chiloscyllium punctatum]|uniref:Uncharacterized protein n=1 Tax=Chiloscyllium punctatum TaxID=137246 RepID=A0A401SUV7_CHIPU|nr:hypothetical protein [Chiloscyllium punctatum]